MNGGTAQLRNGLESVQLAQFLAANAFQILTRQPPRLAPAFAKSDLFGRPILQGRKFFVYITIVLKFRAQQKRKVQNFLIS
jgi:hypothetical protein